MLPEKGKKWKLLYRYFIIEQWVGPSYFDCRTFKTFCHPEENEEIELDFSGFITEVNEDLDYIKAKRCRKVAQKCRDGLLKKIENKEL